MGRALRRASVVLLVMTGLVFAAGAAAADPPTGFVDEVLPLSGLAYPTNVEFAPDGRVFVAEKRGTIQVYDSINDSSPTLFADLRPNVNDYWDRGLLGLAVHPDFPTQPYVYALYTYAVPLDPTMPTWSGSGCPDPPGGTDDGCVVSGRLSRLTASGNQSIDETVLIRDWCQQYPSHSIGDLKFGPDGALYASGGDGASFSFVDYGQGGGDAGSPTPENPCGDPPVPVGGDQTAPSAEGGALRSQDLRTSGDPITLDGSVIRIDPITGDPLPDNPASGASNENEERIVAYGLRNPFRMAIQPGTGNLYLGDVGWGTWEEVNVVPAGSGVLNFGWPCYEGGSGTSLRQGPYDSANLTICETLYGQAGAVSPSLFAYDHNNDITGSDECPPAPPPQPTSSSISGLVFYEGGNYPADFDGALFGSDYSRGCIWVMYDGAGNPDPTTVEVFQDQARNPVDLEIGPGGDVYYVDIINHKVRRIRYTASNTPPVAVIHANPQSGPAPLTVNFDATGSSDPDGDAIVSYDWDMDNDGAFDDASGATPSWTFSQPGSFPVRLRIVDSRGESDADSITILASNTAPEASIDSPSSTLTWKAGDTISFSGSATDPEEGDLPPSSLTWQVILHHCATVSSCHQHPLQSFNGVASGSFGAPDHEYPSFLELKLTAEDQFGEQSTISRDLQPKLVDLTVATSPTGLNITFNGDTDTAPFTETWIVGATVEISTVFQQQSGGFEWVFQSWSAGSSPNLTFPAPSSNTTYTATFDAIPRLVTALNQTHPENQLEVVDIATADPIQVEGAGLTYSLTGGVDQSRFAISSTSGILSFKAPPDFENPGDSNGDNIYEVGVTVTDSADLSDSGLFKIQVTDANDPPVADAGPDRSVTLGQTASLDGTSSSDPDEGDFLTYSWSITVRPAGSTVNLNGPETATPKLTPDIVGDYTVRLEVSDGTATDIDHVTVSTKESSNLPPDADAGPDQSITFGETAVLDGTGSSDPDGDPLTYSWSITSRPSGSSASLVGANSAKPKLTPDVAGSYEVSLTVDDGVHSDTDAVVVQVSEVKGSTDTFKDDDDSIFESSIEWMAAKGITRGCNPPLNDLFCPDDFVTRGQMSAFFARAFGWTDDGDGDLFKDDDNSVFEHDIDLMGTAGVTKGCNPPTNDRFCPDDFVSRGQMAAFFARALGWADDGGGDLFKDDNSSVFEHEIDLMGAAGVTKGCNPPDNDRFCPDDLVTREQMAAFFERAWKAEGLS